MAPLNGTPSNSQSEEFAKDAIRAQEIARGQRGADVTRDTCQRKRGHPKIRIHPAVLLFRDYLVQGLLGEGRFGAVWRCQHRETGDKFACKQIDRAEGAAALNRELECFTRVQGHTNVLGLEGVFESERFVYLLTELCDGGDLFDEIDRNTRLEESSARDLFNQLIHGVHHCHRHGVIHRDIKPENVLLTTCPTTGQKVVKLADFGLSTRLQLGEKTIGWVGSEPYEAPEVLASRPYDFSADVFSLGVVLFCMLSGTWPTFKGAKEFNGRGDFSWPGWDGVSEEAKDLITRMLSRNAKRRPTMHAISEDQWINLDLDQLAKKEGTGSEGRVSVGDNSLSTQHEHTGACGDSRGDKGMEPSPLTLSLQTLCLSEFPGSLRAHEGAMASDCCATTGEGAKVLANSWHGQADSTLSFSRRRLALQSPEGSGTDISWGGSALSSPSTASEYVDSPVESRRRSLGIIHLNL